ncbi:hypothetical protein FO519_001317 [Halicephalobus sp. NKZ332]|nr:hypothetical protein FO519_001317 [Halicephalobus sp. NKZ332]
MLTYLEDALPVVKYIDGDDYVISDKPVRLSVATDTEDMYGSPMTQMAIRVFEVLMYGTIYGKELKKIFVNGYLDNAKVVEDQHISPDTKALLCQDHTNDLRLSEAKFRFYADVGLLSELLKVRVPVVHKQKPIIISSDRNRVLVRFNLDRTDHIFYECALYIVEYDYIVGKSWNVHIINGTIQKLEKQKKNRATICLLKRTGVLDPDKEYNIYIKPNTSGYEDLYHAMGWMTEREYINKKIFGVPEIREDMDQFIQKREKEMSEMLVNDTILNNYQKEAIYSICTMNGDYPFILFGPPGTGKTTTLIEAIRYLRMQDERTRFLVCTSSNAAADHFTLALMNAGFINTADIHRSMSPRVDFDSRDRRLDDVILADEYRYIISEGDKYSEYTVIISTIGNCARIRPPVKNFFTHIFIDEAGQATEPDTWVPLAHFGRRQTKFIFAGDPKQLGPVLIDSVLERTAYRFDQSLLIRLYELPVYHQDPRLMIQLKHNYRNHEAVVQIASRLFYDDTLIPTYPPGHDSFVHPEKSSILGPLEYPVLFHAVEGRESGDQYLFNEKEISVVLRYVEALLSPSHVPRLEPSDIGIISPYREQATRLNEMLPYEDLTVDTVERFQGSERRVVIITTTRSRKIGFLSDYRRVNTAITRAKQLLIIIGHPRLLCQDEIWHLLIDCLMTNRCYVVEDGHFRNDPEYGLKNEKAQKAVDLISH